jgi:hypothetical protein
MPNTLNIYINTKQYKKNFKPLFFYKNHFLFFLVFVYQQKKIDEWKHFSVMLDFKEILAKLNFSFSFSKKHTLFSPIF